MSRCDARKRMMCPQSSRRDAKSLFLCDSSCTLWTVFPQEYNKKLFQSYGASLRFR